MKLVEVGVERPRSFIANLNRSRDGNYALTFANREATLVSALAVQQLYKGRAIHISIKPGQLIAVKLKKR